MKTILLILLVVILLFVVHVPILSYVSRASFYPSLNKYEPIEQGLQNDRFEIVRLFRGPILNTWFDPDQQVLFIYTQTIDDEGVLNYKREIFRIDGDGQLVMSEPVTDEELDLLINATNFKPAQSIPSKAYRSDYRFKDSQGVFELEHFDKTSFHWPYFFYFIPVITFNWSGVGYIKMQHDGSDFYFHLPLDYDSFSMYINGSYDGQLYYYPLDGMESKVALLYVSESSYSQGNGKETHRRGYGVYVIREKH